MSPIISVLMSAHNEENVIEDSVRSVLNELDLPLEFIVVNDRSTDNTEKILRTISEADSRLRIITRVTNIDEEDHAAGKYYTENHGHGGQATALNLGLKFCCGRYIARLDADDICLPNRFKKQLAFMEENPEVSFLGSSALRINHKGKIFGMYHVKSMSHNEIINKIRSFEAYSPHSTWFVKKELYERLGGYSRQGYRAEDLDFMLRVIEQGDIKFAFLTQPLICLRMHPNSLSYTGSITPTEYAICAVVRHYLRLKGCVPTSINNDQITYLVRQEIQKTGLRKKIISYDYLKSSYIGFKDGSYVSALLGIWKSFIASPSVLVDYKILSRKKIIIAQTVVGKYFT